MRNSNTETFKPRRVRRSSHAFLSSVPGDGLRDAFDEASWADVTIQCASVWKDQASQIYMNWQLCDRALISSASSRENSQESSDIFGIRGESGVFRRIRLETMDGEPARLKHDAARQMILRLSMCEMIRFIENCLLEARGIFLRGNPSVFFELHENRGLKRLYENRLFSTQDWGRAWSSYLRRSGRNKDSRGMETLVSQYWENTGLSLPKRYENMQVAQLAKTFSLFSEILVHLKHGTKRVGTELAKTSALIACKDLTFLEGEPFVINARQMEVIEGFFFEYLDVLVTALGAVPHVAPREAGAGLRR